MKDLANTPSATLVGPLTEDLYIARGREPEKFVWALRAHLI